MARDRRKIEDVSLPPNYIDLLSTFLPPPPPRDSQQAVDRAEDLALERLAVDHRVLPPVILTGRQPNPALLFSYLCYALPTASDERAYGKAAVEALRVKAVEALHTLLRRWKAEIRVRRSAASFVAEISGRRLPWSEELQAFQRAREHWIFTLGAPPNFDCFLQDFFDSSERANFSRSNPLTAGRVFWEGAPGRGRNKETNAERDFALAVAVQERVNAGVSIEEASYVVGANASPRPLSQESVRKIYNKRRREVLRFYYPWRCEVRADLALVGLFVSQP